METTKTEKYFIFGLLIIAIAFTLAIFSPFLTLLVLAIAFSVVLSPIYKWIKSHLVFNISWLASLLTVIIFLVGLCIPLFFIGRAVFYQTQNVYFDVVDSGGTTHFMDTINHSINKFLPTGFNFDIRAKISALATSLTNNLAEFFGATLNSILMFVLTILTLFYLLKDGEKWKNELIKIFPMRDEDTNIILSTLKKSINRILKGSFIIALAQGSLAWLGFVFFGVPNAVLWAVVAGICSFVPTIGTSVVTVPAILFLFFSGMEIQSLGLLLWSLLLVGTIDNMLEPYIISKDTEISSLFVLFAILGGIALVGPMGILIGPLALSLLYSLVSIYKKDLKN